MSPTIRCVHCGGESVVKVGGHDVTVVGFSKTLHRQSDRWLTSSCTDCHREFGVRLNSAMGGDG